MVININSFSYPEIHARKNVRKNFMNTLIKINCIIRTNCIHNLKAYFLEMMDEIC